MTLTLIITCLLLQKTSSKYPNQGHESLEEHCDDKLSPKLCYFAVISTRRKTVSQGAHSNRDNYIENCSIHHSANRSLQPCFTISCFTLPFSHIWPWRTYLTHDGLDCIASNGEVAAWFILSDWVCVTTYHPATLLLALIWGVETWDIQNKARWL